MARRVIFILYILFCWAGVSAQQNSLYILNDIGQGVTSHEVLTGGSFQLDYVISIPSDDCKKVKLTLPSNNNFILSSTGIIYNGQHTITTQGGNIVFQALVSNGQNIKITPILKGNGSLCDNNVISYFVKVQYFDLNDNSCGNELLSNVISIKPKYAFTYTNDLQIQNNGTACKGGFIKYKVILPSRLDLGYYILNNVKFRCEVKGSLVAILGENGSNWTFTEIAGNNSCSKTYEFYYNGASTNTMSLKNYGTTTMDLVFKTECACYTNNLPFQVSLLATGTDPCGRIITFSKDANHIIINSCCATPSDGEVQVSKDLEDFNKPFCAGGCHSYYYYLRYSNSNNASAVNNLTISDPFPNGVKILNINLQRFQYNGIDINYRICYSTQSNPTEQCLVVGSTSRPYGLWVVQIMDITKFKIEFIDTIPAWYNYLIQFPIAFDVQHGVNFLSDNSATFSADSPNFNIVDKVIHGQVSSCPPYYTVYPFFIQNNQSQFQINTFPSAIEKMMIEITNQGSGSNPKANIKVGLPSEISYAGNITLGTQSGNNPIVFQTLSPNIGINYDQDSHELIISDLLIPSCDGQRYYISFDIAIANGALAGIKEVRTSVNNGVINRKNININDYYKINAKIYQRCKSGDLISLENKVLASESLEYVYELENVGNESVDNIILFNHKPAVNDFTLNSPNQTSRNSEVSTNYSGQIYELNQVPVHAQYISSLNGNLICDQNFGGTTAQTESASMMIIKPQDPNFILGPGQKLQIVQKHNIGQGQPLNLSCNNDFSFCLRRINLNTQDNGISDQIRLTLSDTTLCPKIAVCDEMASIESRFKDAFNVQVSGNQVTLTTQNLNSNDQWSLVWDDEQYFANESHWGNQTVSRTFPNNVTGQHKLCIKIKNHLEANNSQSQECKCELICKTFNLN